MSHYPPLPTGRIPRGVGRASPLRARGTSSGALAMGAGRSWGAGLNPISHLARGRRPSSRLIAVSVDSTSTSARESAWLARGRSGGACARGRATELTPRLMLTVVWRPRPAPATRGIPRSLVANPLIPPPMPLLGAPPEAEAAAPPVALVDTWTRRPRHRRRRSRTTTRVPSVVLPRRVARKIPWAWTRCPRP